MILIDIRAFGNILGHSVTLRAATVGPPPVVVKCTLSMVTVGFCEILDTIPSLTHCLTHILVTDNLILPHYEFPTFTILRVESLAALGRSRQSFSQFCSNFSSGHFAAREGKKAAHNI